MDIGTLLITYGLLFLGELGDKTQLIVFNLALEYKKFYKLGIGITLAFALLVSIGVFFGAIITKFLPLFLISIISGIVFLIIGFLEALNLRRLYLQKKSIQENNEISKNLEKEADIQQKYSKLKKNPYLAGFIYIFLMELGDKTQLLTISLSAIFPPTEVWLGSFLALISVAWIGIFLGALIARKVPKFYLKLISTLIFIIVGILIIISSF
ncbi:MAG: TMEM165/GDT1 family protein [Candidatus Thorarchaeota archaeon]